MNFCILYGKIISDIKFDFIYKAKDISIARFYIEISNKSIIQVKAYNELADYVYSKLEKGSMILIKGKLYGSYVFAEEVNSFFK